MTLRVIPRRDGIMRTPPGHLMISNDVICIEDLDIRGMLEQKFMSKSIADAAWGEFIRMLEYKAGWYGRTVLRSDRYSPTSQRCCACGNINPEVKDLSIRRWECPVCHTVHDRDVNAAINVKTDALRIAGLL